MDAASSSGGSGLLSPGTNRRQSFRAFRQGIRSNQTLSSDEDDELYDDDGTGVEEYYTRKVDALSSEALMNPQGRAQTPPSPSQMRQYQESSPFAGLSPSQSLQSASSLSPSASPSLLSSSPVAAAAVAGALPPLDRSMTRSVSSGSATAPFTLPPEIVARILKSSSDGSDFMSNVMDWGPPVLGPTSRGLGPTRGSPEGMSRGVAAGRGGDREDAMDGLEDRGIGATEEGRLRGGNAFSGWVGYVGQPKGAAAAAAAALAASGRTGADSRAMMKPDPQRQAPVATNRNRMTAGEVQAAGAAYKPQSASAAGTSGQWGGARSPSAGGALVTAGSAGAAAKGGNGSGRSNGSESRTWAMMGGGGSGGGAQEQDADRQIVFGRSITSPVRRLPSPLAAVREDESSQAEDGGGKTSGGMTAAGGGGVGQLSRAGTVRASMSTSAVSNAATSSVSAAAAAAAADDGEDGMRRKPLPAFPIAQLLRQREEAAAAAAAGSRSVSAGDKSAAAAGAVVQTKVSAGERDGPGSSSAGSTNGRAMSAIFKPQPAGEKRPRAHSFQGNSAGSAANLPEIRLPPRNQPSAGDGSGMKPMDQFELSSGASTPRMGPPLASSRSLASPQGPPHQHGFISQSKSVGQAAWQAGQNGGGGTSSLGFGVQGMSGDSPEGYAENAAALSSTTSSSLTEGSSEQQEGVGSASGVAPQERKDPAASLGFNHRLRRSLGARVTPVAGVEGDDGGVSDADASIASAIRPTLRIRNADASVSSDQSNLQNSEDVTSGRNGARLGFSNEDPGPLQRSSSTSPPSEEFHSELQRKYVSERFDLPEVGDMMPIVRPRTSAGRRSGPSSLNNSPRQDESYSSQNASGGAPLAADLPTSPSERPKTAAGWRSPRGPPGGSAQLAAAPPLVRAYGAVAGGEQANQQAPAGSSQRLLVQTNGVPQQDAVPGVQRGILRRGSESGGSESLGNESGRRAGGAQGVAAAARWVPLTGLHPEESTRPAGPMRSKSDAQQQRDSPPDQTPRSVESVLSRDTSSRRYDTFGSSLGSTPDSTYVGGRRFRSTSEPMSSSDTDEAADKNASSKNLHSSGPQAKFKAAGLAAVAVAAAKAGAQNGGGGRPGGVIANPLWVDVNVGSNRDGEEGSFDGGDEDWKKRLEAMELLQADMSTPRPKTATPGGREAARRGKEQARGWGDESDDEEEGLFDQSVVQYDKKVVEEVFKQVEEENIKQNHYKSLIAFIIFFAIYMTMLFLQAQSSRGFQLSSAHSNLLPEGVAGDSSVTFSEASEFYDWLNSSIIQVLWADPPCGNGVCERPLEFPQFGDYGCPLDCKAMQNTTTVAISMSSSFASEEARAASWWNLCMHSPVRLCWFSSPQTFPSLSNQTSTQLDLPDGDWQLVLTAPLGGVRGVVDKITPDTSANPSTSAAAPPPPPVPPPSRKRRNPPPAPAGAALGLSSSSAVPIRSFGGCVAASERTALDTCREACAFLSTCLLSVCSLDLPYSVVAGGYVDCKDSCLAAPDAIVALANDQCNEDLLPSLLDFFSNIECNAPSLEDTASSKVDVSGAVSSYSPRAVRPEEPQVESTEEHRRRWQRRGPSGPSSDPIGPQDGEVSDDELFRDYDKFLEYEGDQEEGDGDELTEEERKEQEEWERGEEVGEEQAFERAEGEMFLKAAGLTSSDLTSDTHVVEDESSIGPTEEIDGSDYENQQLSFGGAAKAGVYVSGDWPQQQQQQQGERQTKAMGLVAVAPAPSALSNPGMLLADAVADTADVDMSPTAASSPIVDASSESPVAGETGSPSVETSGDASENSPEASPGDNEEFAAEPPEPSMEQELSGDTKPEISANTDPPSSLWAAMGPSNAARLSNLRIAIGRMLFSMAGSECLAAAHKGLSLASRERLTAFFCTLLGGPKEMAGCAYYDEQTGERVNSTEGLSEKMREAHSRIREMGEASRQHQEVFVEMVINAVHSVIVMDESQRDTWRNLLHAFDSAVVSSESSGCQRGTSLLWRPGSSIVTSISEGQKLTWVWGDDSPRSIKVAGVGDSSSSPFVGFGSGRLLLSRAATCNPFNIGPDDEFETPAPCVLRSPSDASSSSFSFSAVFSTPGTYRYVSGNVADGSAGTIRVLNTSTPTDPSLNLSSPFSFQCSLGCQLALISNGRCDAACNTAGCAFDGGDCACSSGGSGGSGGSSQASSGSSGSLGACECGAGLVRADDGTCCSTLAIGSNIAFPFRLRSFGSDLVASNPDLALRQSDPLPRFVAERNKLLTGLYIRQTRRKGKACRDNRFKVFSRLCVGEPSGDPFGANPVFLEASSLYSPATDTMMKILRTSNSSTPFTINPSGVPYGFSRLHQNFSDPSGFHVIFDINLSNAVAAKWLQYLADGFFLDNSTSTVTTTLITFNSDTSTFVLVEMVMEFQIGGKISVKGRVVPVTVDLYSEPSSYWLRATFELLYVLLVAWNIFEEMRDCCERWREEKSFWAYFLTPWNWADILSIALQVANVVIWCYIYFDLCANFSISPRYNVYQSLNDDNLYFAVSNPPTGYQQALASLAELENIIAWLSTYFALQGISVVWVVLRLLKLMDFQPYIGVITRSLSAAGQSLLHFFFLFSVIFFAYAMFGYLVFGRNMEQFRTLGNSLITCFLLGLGDSSTVYFFLQLEGWNYVAAIIFWVSYTIIMVFILLNFLIAIILDAFTEVKQLATGAKPIYYDLFCLLRNFGHRMFGPYYKLDRLMRHLEYLKEAEVDYKPALMSWSNLKKMSNGDDQHPDEAKGDEGEEEEEGLVKRDGRQGDGRNLRRRNKLRLQNETMDYESLATVIERSYRRKDAFFQEDEIKDLDPDLMSDIIMSQLGRRKGASEGDENTSNGEVSENTKEIELLKEDLESMRIQMEKSFHDLKQLVASLKN